jgi:hypothetical protein
MTLGRLDEREQHKGIDEVFDVLPNVTYLIAGDGTDRNRLRHKVPEGLDYFSYGNFERRCHAIVDSVLNSRTNRGCVP